MKISDLSEAPIQDLKFIGDTDFEDRKFGHTSMPTKRDVAPITNPKGFEKIINAFKKTPFYFNFYIMKKDAYNAHKHLDQLDSIITNKKNSITFIVTNNATSERKYVPLTSWILAHRLGHALQIRDLPVHGKLFNKMNNKFQEQFMGIMDDPKEYKKLGTGAALAFFQDLEDKEFAFKMFTMRSARIKQLNNPLDYFPELFAQYLMTGQVTFNKIGTPEQQKKIAYLERWCNKAFPHVLNNMVGGVYNLF